MLDEPTPIPDTREQLRADALAQLKRGQQLLLQSKENLDIAQEQIKIAQQLIDDSAEMLRTTANHHRNDLYFG